MVPKRFPFPMRSTRSLAFTLLVCALSSGGCSFLFVHGPPADHASRSFFTCTDRKVLPMVELVLGAGLVLALPFQPSTDQVGTGTNGLLHFVAGVYGLGKVTACRRALDSLRVRLRVVGDSVGALGSGR